MSANDIMPEPEDSGNPPTEPIDTQALIERAKEDTIYHVLLDAIATRKLGLIDAATILDVYEIQSFSTSLTGKPDTSFEYVAQDLKQLHDVFHDWLNGHGYIVGRFIRKDGSIEYFSTSDINNPKAYAYFADPRAAYRYVLKLIAPAAADAGAGAGGGG